MVTIDNRYSTLIRQYCVLKQVPIKDFLEETFEGHEKLNEFKEELQKLRRIKNE